VADYYTPEQLVQKLGISESILADLELKGLLQPKLKDGRRFFSSRQMYESRLALRLARKQNLTLEKAFSKIEELRLYRFGTNGPKP
jgi:DNA-binding transcriptional MerR regulator